MAKNSFTLIQGYHLTATEIKAIKQMLSNGMTWARNKPNTKNYTIVEGWQEQNKWHYKIKIGTFATHNIGALPSWDYNLFTIKLN